MLGQVAVPGQDSPKGQIEDVEEKLHMCSRMLCLAAARPECIYFLPWARMQWSGHSGDSGSWCMHSLVSPPVGKGGGSQREQSWLAGGEGMLAHIWLGDQRLSCHRVRGHSL